MGVLAKIGAVTIGAGSTAAGDSGGLAVGRFQLAACLVTGGADVMDFVVLDAQWYSGCCADRSRMAGVAGVVCLDEATVVGGQFAGGLLMTLGAVASCRIVMSRLMVDVTALKR